MDKFVYYGELFSIYSFLLTKKKQDIVKLYYEENLSLSEIAEIKKVSKSYVGKIITDTKKRLDFYEKNLKHYELMQKLKK